MNQLTENEKNLKSAILTLACIVDILQKKDENSYGENITKQIAKEKLNDLITILKEM